MRRPIVPPSADPPRLLVVDDDAILKETLSDLLQLEGFQVTSAGGGEEAEHLLAEARPPFDLVITDLVMPGKNGMHVLQCALKANPSATVLILSGYGSVREATEAMEKGAYGLLTKPLQIDTFRHTLARLLERAQILAERDALRARVRELEARVEALETTKGRMEMLAYHFNPTTPQGTAPATLVDLERLADLHSKGMLSKEQFETAKEVLLARWNP